MNVRRVFLGLVLFLLAPRFMFSQGSHCFNCSGGPVIGSSGLPIASPSIRVCPALPVITIAASPTGATESGTTVTITTTAAHALVVNESITIAGVGVSSYNGSFTVATVPTTTTFTYVSSLSGLASSGAGSVTVPAGSCLPLSSLFIDQAESSAAANPLSGTALGNYDFYVAPSTYRIDISGTGITATTVNNIPIGFHTSVLPSDALTGDACVQMNAGITVGPSGGILVSGQKYQGSQACAANATTATIPLTLYLGAATFKPSVAWTLGRDTGTGQYIIGAGADVTNLQPTSATLSPSVISLTPQGANKLFRQATVRDLSIDMVNQTNGVALDLQSTSNLGEFSGIVVKNNAGQHVHAYTSAIASAQQSEGLHFLGSYFISSTPKQATGVLFEDTNDASMIDSKVLGVTNEGSQIGVVVRSTTGSTNSFGCAFIHSAIAGWATALNLTATGAFIPAERCFIAGSWFEAATTGVKINGFNSANKANFNTLIGNNFLSTVTTPISMTNASNNIIIDTEISATNGITMGAGAIDNLIIHNWLTTNKAEVSDVDGNNNAYIGAAPLGVGVDIGRGGAGAQNESINIDAGLTGNPIINLQRREVTKGQLIVSDALSAGEVIIVAGSNNYRFGPGATPQFLIPNPTSGYTAFQGPAAATTTVIFPAGNPTVAAINLANAWSANQPFTTLSATGQIVSTLAIGTAPFSITSTTNVPNLNASSLSGATFATPGAIGSGTPSTGAFTTLSATGNLTPSQTNGIVGTTTNNNANAGSVGEYVSSTIATGASVALTTGTTANITSISLTAGDWDVTGAVDFTLGATTSITNLIGGISTTSATIGAQDSFFDFETPASVPTATNDQTWTVPVVRLSLAGTTTVYLVAQGIFSISTLKGYGTIRARRIR